MSGALLNLVRLNAANETAPRHDYTSGEVFDRREEIKLETPDGEPCAIPMPSRFQNIDHKYNYITGAKGHQARGILRNISINVDYIGNDVARRLESWMHQRARVLVCPNMGRNTDFSFRPVRMNGATYAQGGGVSDLTGNHSYSFSSSSPQVVAWDYVSRRFSKKSVSNSLPLIGTPGGGGYEASAPTVNRAAPGYPASVSSGAGAGKSGWFWDGADVSQLTVSHNAGAFGHPDCPDTLGVAFTDDVSSARYLYMQPGWDPALGSHYQGYTFTGECAATVCVWVRGTFPDNAAIRFGLAGGGETSRDLSGESFPGWTPILLSLYETDWSIAIPRVQIDFNATEGAAGAVEIGPVMVQHNVSEFYSPQALWTGSTTGASLLSTNGNLSMPEQGMLIASFFVPDYHDEPWAVLPFYGIAGGSDWFMYAAKGLDEISFLRIGSSTGNTTIKAAAVGAAGSLVPGRVNTAAYAWSGDRQRFYINGHPLGDIDRSTEAVNFASNNTALKIGMDNQNNAISPAALLSLRIDEGRVTDSEVKNIHLALTDPIALQVAMNARGRVYQIVGVPQTVRASAGGSQVLGAIQLEQVGQQNWLADHLNTEESVS